MKNKEKYNLTDLAIGIQKDEELDELLISIQYDGEVLKEIQVNKDCQCQYKIMLSWLEEEA